MKTILAAMAFLGAFVMVTLGQSSNTQNEDTHAPQSSCPMHDAHAKMNDRGEKAMGFSQTATTHHFLLKSNGGVIQVEVNDPSDSANRDNIRVHLEHIAKAFQDGDFDIPMFVHGAIPPGEPEMKSLRKSIRYSFEETPNGGRVVISTADKDALDAIHRFLRFQIEEHKTGDSIEIH